MTPNPTIPLRNAADRYGLVARALHWTIGLLLLAQLAGGFYVFEFMAKGATRSALIGVHKAMGVTILLLVLARVAWRLYDRPPALPAVMPALEQAGTRVGHAALYLAMLAMPLVGLWVADSGGRATDVFGLFEVPVLIGAGETEFWHEVAETTHVWGAYLLLALIALHAITALYHKFLKRDALADRML